MIEEIIIRSGPQTSIFEVNAWQKLPQLLTSKNIKKALVIHGEISWQKFKSKFPKMANIEVHYEKFAGECTYEEAYRLADKAKEVNADILISVGGGKNNDCVKMAATKYNHAVAIMPTLAATCAAWTPVCVMYNEAGEMVDFPILNKATDILLVDFAIILDSPKIYMIAGIGDTLAKWYESDVVIRYMNEKSTAIELAHDYAKRCKDNIIDLAEEAITSLEAQTLTASFNKIVETNIMISGMVGGFGDRYARTTAAHSIHDALTLLPETHQILHGDKVAYGILVQLVLEHRLTEIKALLPFYHKLGLPTNLKAINLEHITQDALYTVATRATQPEEDIHLLPEKITAESLLLAIEKLEDITNS